MAFYRSKTRLEPQTEGFHGVYWENKKPTDCAIIMMLGDDSEDMMAKGGAKWGIRRGVNVMTMSPAKKDYGHHNYPLERFRAALYWLKAHGNMRFAIGGASTTGTAALVAASFYSEFTLTLAFTPSDFVWEGFMRGKRDGCGEWPVDGESTFSFQGKPLPYMPFLYRHPQYWQTIQEEAKSTHNMVASRRIFDDSEAAGLIPEEAFIRVEKIKGKLLLVGAEDDVLWDTVRYIRRMDERLKRLPHACEYEVLTYEHGTHFIFPQSMLKTILPVGSGLLIRCMFEAGRKFSAEGRRAREEIDRKVCVAIQHWKDGKE